MNEISYYEEFADKFITYIQTYLGKDYIIHYSINKTLDTIIDDLRELTGKQIISENIYIPKLKIDIVFAIHRKNEPVKLILVEAKYLNQLRLIDYSQLVGYLQVGKIIDLGLLLLIQKEYSTNKLSNAFQEIIRLKKLPMEWVVQLKPSSEKHQFQTGILYYVPNNGIDWINTSELNGISSFEELIVALKK